MVLCNKLLSLLPKKIHITYFYHSIIISKKNYFCPQRHLKQHKRLWDFFFISCKYIFLSFVKSVPICPLKECSVTTNTLEWAPCHLYQLLKTSDVFHDKHWDHLLSEDFMAFLFINTEPHTNVHYENTNIGDVVWPGLVIKRSWIQVHNLQIVTVGF